MSLYCGWDISSSIVGCCILEEDGTIVYVGHCDLRDAKDLFTKAQLIENFIDGELGKVWERNEPTVHFIEDRLSGFTRGFTSQQTLLKLASFNGIASWILFKEFGNVKHIHPSTVKSVMKLGKPTGNKKDRNLAKVLDLYPSTFSVQYKKNSSKVKDYYYDMADAVLVALTGLKKFGKK